MIENFSELALLSTFKLETCCLVSHCVDSTGFAFVYMEDERDADDAIRRLDRIEFGRKGRRLRVEWTKVCTFILPSWCFACKLELLLTF